MSCIAWVASRRGEARSGRLRWRSARGRGSTRGSVDLNTEPHQFVSYLPGLQERRGDGLCQVQPPSFLADYKSGSDSSTLNGWVTVVGHACTSTVALALVYTDATCVAPHT